MAFFFNKTVKITNDSQTDLYIQMEAKAKEQNNDQNMETILFKQSIRYGTTQVYNSQHYKAFLVKLYDEEDEMVCETALLPGEHWIVSKEDVWKPKKEDEMIVSYNGGEFVSGFIYGVIFCFILSHPYANLLHK